MGGRRTEQNQGRRQAFAVCDDDDSGEISLEELSKIDPMQAARW